MIPKKQCIFYKGQKLLLIKHTGRYPKDWDFLNFMRGKPCTIKEVCCINTDYNDFQCLGDCWECRQLYIKIEETNEMSWSGIHFQPFKGGEMKNVWEIIVINKENNEILTREIIIDGDEKSVCSKVSIKCADKLKNLVFDNLFYVTRNLGSYETKR